MTAGLTDTVSPEELRAEMVRLIRDGRAVAMADLAKQTGVSRPHLQNFMTNSGTLAAERIPAIAAALRGLATQAADLPTLRSHYRASLELVARSFDLRFLVGADVPEELHDPRVDAFFVEPSLTELNSAERTQLGDAMRRHNVVSIFGPAGSGKTTLLLHESLLLIRRESGPLPIYFPLNALTPMLDDRRSSGRHITNLLDAISFFYESTADGVAPRPLFEDAIKRGHAIVMLDGLDEVTRDFARTAVEYINVFIDTRLVPRGNHVIVTERGTATFGKGSLIRRATTFHMCPFEPPQREELVRRWLDLAYEERDPQREQNLLAALESPRLADLVSNPLFLTLLTVVVIKGAPQQLFAEPSRAGTLEMFFRTILGSWNNLRARDGRPTPVADQFGEYVSLFLITSLAHAMIREPSDVGGPYEIEDDIGIEKAEIELLKIYRAEGGAADESPFDQNLRDKIRGFIDRCRGAGLLQDVGPRVKFVHQVVRDWFLGLWLSQHADLLEDNLLRVIAQPSQEFNRWEQPLAFALAALVVVRIDHSRARELAQRAIRERPLGVERLRRVLPLGLEICGSFTMATAELDFIDAALIPQLMEFYEQTDYALVTNHLQPMMVALVHRAPARYRVPRSVPSLTRALAEHADADDARWIEWVERVWRYQTDFGCLRLLAEATQRRGLPQPAQEKLLRRILFGMNFVADFGPEAADFLGEIIANRAYSDSDVRQMASYTLFEQRQHLLERHPDSPLISKIDAVIARTTPPHAVTAQRQVTNIPELIERLKTMPIRHVIERSGGFLRQLRTSGGLRAADCLDALVSLIESRYSQSEPRRIDVRETAVALILTARLYSEGDEDWSIRDLHKGGRHERVLGALLRAADVSDAAQYENVGACQVYDFAVWALRSIFLGSFEVAGLPLPPADLGGE